MKAKNYDYLIGKRFGKIIVLSKTQKINKHKKVECLCDCGKKFLTRVDGIELRKSCGCSNYIRTGKNNFLYIDGRTKERLYKIWIKMKERCLNKKDNAYKDYGGRGIVICEEWDNYPTFRKWALENGYKEHLTIDRINNDGNYESKNCRWATMKEQSRNRRNNVMISYLGEIKSVVEWCEILNLDYGKQRAKIRYYYDKTKELKLIF